MGPSGVYPHTNQESRDSIRKNQETDFSINPPRAPETFWLFWPQTKMLFPHSQNRVLETLPSGCQVNKVQMFKQPPYGLNKRHSFAIDQGGQQSNKH